MEAEDPLMRPLQAAAKQKENMYSEKSGPICSSKLLMPADLDTFCQIHGDMMLVW